MKSVYDLMVFSLTPFLSPKSYFFIFNDVFGSITEGQEGGFCCKWIALFRRVASDQEAGDGGLFSETNRHIHCGNNVSQVERNMDFCIRTDDDSHTVA